MTIRQFPVLHVERVREPTMSVPPITRVPWDFVAPHELQVRRNHQQTLERLAERGGLSETELLAVLEDRLWCSMDRENATRKIHELLAVWLASNG